MTDLFLSRSLSHLPFVLLFLPFPVLQWMKEVSFCRGRREDYTAALGSLWKGQIEVSGGKKWEEGEQGIKRREKLSMEDALLIRSVVPSLSLSLCLPLLLDSITLSLQFISFFAPRKLVMLKLLFPCFGPRHGLVHVGAGHLPSQLLIGTTHF